MTRAYKLSLISGITAGYAVLAGLLFWQHENPSGVMADLLPFFAVGAIGLLVLLFSPGCRSEPEVAGKPSLLAIAGCGPKLNWLQISGLVAAGFFLGALLSKVIRLVF